MSSLHSSRIKCTEDMRKNMKYQEYVFSCLSIPLHSKRQRISFFKPFRMAELNSPLSVFMHMYDRKSDMSFYLLDFYEPYKVPIITKSASWCCGFVSASAVY